MIFRRLALPQSSSFRRPRIASQCRLLESSPERSYHLDLSLDFQFVEARVHPNSNAKLQPATATISHCSLGLNWTYTHHKEPIRFRSGSSAAVGWWVLLMFSPPLRTVSSGWCAPCTCTTLFTTWIWSNVTFILPFVVRLIAANSDFLELETTESLCFSRKAIITGHHFESWSFHHSSYVFYSLSKSLKSLSKLEIRTLSLVGTTDRRQTLTVIAGVNFFQNRTSVL